MRLKDVGMLVTFQHGLTLISYQCINLIGDKPTKIRKHIIIYEIVYDASYIKVGEDSTKGAHPQLLPPYTLLTSF